MVCTVRLLCVYIRTYIISSCTSLPSLPSLQTETSELFRFAKKHTLLELPRISSPEHFKAVCSTKQTRCSDSVCTYVCVCVCVCGVVWCVCMCMHVYLRVCVGVWCGCVWYSLANSCSSAEMVKAVLHTQQWHYDDLCPFNELASTVDMYVPVTVLVHFLTRYNVRVSRQTGTLQSPVQRVNEGSFQPNPTHYVPA